MATVTPEPRILRLIDNHLWCCGYGGISVFDFALNHLRDIKLQKTFDVLGAADVGDGAVVAAINGLFLITYAGMLI